MTANVMRYIACDLAPGMTLDEYRRAMANQRRRERAKVRSDRRRSLRRYLGRVVSVPVPIHRVPRKRRALPIRTEVR